MIESFSNSATQKIFSGENLTKKERKSVGALNIEMAQRNLQILDLASEKDLLLSPALHYRRLQGSDRFSIDADARNSPWRITFKWTNEQLIDVELVHIEDTH